MALFVLDQDINMYSLPGTNHALIKGESSSDSFRQRKYFNTKIRNTNDSTTTLDNIDNPVTADDAYPDTNLRRTLFRFISYTRSTSYILDTGVNPIVLNDVRKFKVFHPCKGNIKCIGGSNFSIRGTDTTEITDK